MPPFKSALKILRSPSPLTAAGQERHSWYGMYVALSLVMLFAMVILLASDGAPFVDPWSSLWTYKFEFHVFPSRNWPVLIRCASYAVLACSVGYLGSLLAGLQLHAGARATRAHTIRLAGYAALFCGFIYVLTLLLIFAIGWVLYLLKIRVYIFGWMTIAAVALLPVTTWGSTRIFRRTSSLQNASMMPALTISMTTVTMCAVGAIFIMDGLADASIKQGRMVNSARNTPTAAVVQTCAKASADLICAITLFPAKWQDYELIGDWKLGSVPDTSGIHKPHFYWHPQKQADREFALVDVDSHKDITVEIRIPMNAVCKPDGTNIAIDDQFFSVQGRVRGEQRNAPQDMRIHIENGAPAFIDMVTQVCREGASS